MTTQELEIYLTGMINKRIIHFILEYLHTNGITQPEIHHIIEIEEDEIWNSWLSVVSTKELLLFQQQLKNQ